MANNSSYETEKKDGQDVLTSATTYISDDPKEVAARKNRQNNKKYDDYKSRNPYQKAAMRELLTGEVSKGKAAVDFGVDFLIPTILGIALGHASKKTPGYKRAKLREAADMTDYSLTGPEVITHLEGSTTKPYGQLSRAVKKLYGSEKLDNALTEKELGEKLMGAVKKIKAHNPDATEDEILSLIEAVRTGKSHKLANEQNVGFIEEAVKSVKNPAQIIVDKNIKTEKIPMDSGGEKTKIVVDNIDKLNAGLPYIADTLATANAVNAGVKYIPKAFTDDFDPEERMRQLRKTGSGGLASSSLFDGIPTISEIFNSTNLKYDKKEVIKNANKIFDYIMENGNEEQLKQALSIYGDTNFNNRGEAVDALKSMLKIIED